MPNQLSAQSDFTQTLAVHLAVRAALKSSRFKSQPAVRQGAEKLARTLEGDHSIYGRQLAMLRLMEKGATLAELGRKLHCSRRTIFRYLNHLEEAGVKIELEGTKYHIEKSVAKMLKF